VLLAAIVVLGLSRCGDGGDDDPGPPDSAETLNARVSEVVDGDTVEVELPDGRDEDVRYIGIDTPETAKPGTPGECGAALAEQANRRLVGGREVTLRLGVERRDDYGRLLAYVYVPGAARGGEQLGGRELFVNAELVRRGLARTLTIAPNDEFAAEFERLAARAGRAGRGLWGACAL
jgi:micrococcal nuclease